MNNTVINILGTEYDFKITTDKEDATLINNDGYCDVYKKIIVFESEYNQNDQSSIKDFEALKKRVKRHEIIHAYLAESGLMDFTENEQLVDWIAWQFPKLLKTFTEIDAI